MKNKYNIKIKWESMGLDNVFIITGGESHIGASATAYWVENELICKVNELPHHKEGELARYCAEIAAKTLKKTCSVLIGIHIDNATREEINYIVNFVQKEMENILINRKHL